MPYIGRGLSEGRRQVRTYTATASQTTFIAEYEPGYVDVYQNGIRLFPSDYTATSGSDIVLTVAANASDEITIVSHDAFSVINVGDVSNTYIQAQGYLTTETGDVSNTYLQAQGYLTTETGDVSNTYLQTQLASSDYRAGEVIEEYYLMPDGRQITTVGGTANTEAVTSTQSFTNVQTKITGSELTGYVVPSGAKFVQYSFEVTMWSRVGGGTTSSQVYLYYKIDGGSYNQVQYHGKLSEEQSGSNSPARYMFTFEVGAASANVQLGQMTETTPTLDFKIEMRGRQAAQGATLHTPHGSEPWGTPTTPGTFTPPFVGIKTTAG